mgnify:CR=1 FL=1
MNAAPEIKQGVGIKAKHTAFIYDTTSKSAELLERELERLGSEFEDICLIRDPQLRKDAMERHNIEYAAILAELQEKHLLRKYENTNIVVLAGRSVIAQRLGGINTYSGNINYGVLGSGLTAPSNADTQLTTEVYRKLIANASVSGATVFLDFYFNKSEVSGTFNEWGTVIDGTASANTGQLFTHLLTADVPGGTWSKTSSESMTVAVQYNVT